MSLPETRPTIQELLNQLEISNVLEGIELDRSVEKKIAALEEEEKNNPILNSNLQNKIEYLDLENQDNVRSEYEASISLFK